MILSLLLPHFYFYLCLFNPSLFLISLFIYILFSAEIDGHRICLIRGPEENVTTAQKLVFKAVSDQPVIESTEMFVPQVSNCEVI